MPRPLRHADPQLPGLPLQIHTDLRSSRHPHSEHSDYRRLAGRSHGHSPPAKCRRRGTPGTPRLLMPTSRPPAGGARFTTQRTRGRLGTPTCEEHLHGNAPVNCRGRAAPARAAQLTTHTSRVPVPAVDGLLAPRPSFGPSEGTLGCHRADPAHSSNGAGTTHSSASCSPSGTYSALLLGPQAALHWASSYSKGRSHCSEARLPQCRGGLRDDCVAAVASTTHCSQGSGLV